MENKIKDFQKSLDSFYDTDWSEDFQSSCACLLSDLFEIVKEQNMKIIEIKQTLNEMPRFGE